MYWKCIFYFLFSLVCFLIIFQGGNGYHVLVRVVVTENHKHDALNKKQFCIILEARSSRSSRQHSQVLSEALLPHVQ